MSTKLLKYFLLLAVSFLILSFSIKAQISPPTTLTCDEGYELDRVYDFESESVTVYDYDPVEHRNIPRTELQNVRKLRWKCVPVTSENNPETDFRNAIEQAAREKIREAADFRDAIEKASREKEIDRLYNLNKCLDVILDSKTTLIIKMKDGSKKIIDLSKAETINIAP